MDTMDRKCSKKIANIGMQHGCPMMNCYYMCPMMYPVMCPMTSMGGMNMPMMGMGGMQPSMTQPMGSMMGMGGMQPSMTQPMGSMMGMGSMQPSMTRPMDSMTDVMQDLTADMTNSTEEFNNSSMYDVKMRTVDISEIED